MAVDDDWNDGEARWPEHSNQLGDWCPWSGEPADDTVCPALCPDSDIS